jgi:hypothetical protein
MAPWVRLQSLDEDQWLEKLKRLSGQSRRSNQFSNGPGAYWVRTACFRGCNIEPVSWEFEPNLYHPINGY